MDYTTALEAALVPESDFVSRRLRERAVKVLGLSDDDANKVKSLLKDFYSIRSTLVHGSGLIAGSVIPLAEPRSLVGVRANRPIPDHCRSSKRARGGCGP
jgi:hypothetical protein